MSPSQNQKSTDTVTLEIMRVIPGIGECHAILNNNQVIEAKNPDLFQKGNKVVLKADGGNYYVSEIYDTSGKLLYSKSRV